MSAANKNAPEDIVEKLDSLTDLLPKAVEKFEGTAKEVIELRSAVEKCGTVDNELKAKLDESAASFATLKTSVDEINAQIDYFKKSLDKPNFGSDKDVSDFDKKSTEDILLAKHLMNGGDLAHFKLDGDDLISSKSMHSSFNKLMRAQTKSEFDDIRVKGLTDIEKKSVSISSIGTGFFIPQLLDMIKDCSITCASLVDLYDTVGVSKPTFKYPVIANYGNLGAYGNPDDCAATFGTDSSVTLEGGDVKDWRGAWCMHEDVIRYAAFDFFRIMIESMERSRLITQNQAFILGDANKEPQGWLAANKFPLFKTASVGKFTAADLRLFLSKGPTEFGKTIPVMHPNVFAFLASLVDAHGRFLFGDGSISYNPLALVNEIRVTKCLPDATLNNSLDGTEGKLFTSGAFLAANADWKLAYKHWVLEPMMVRPNFVTGPYCQQWTFRERSGGSMFCNNAGHLLTVA